MKTTICAAALALLLGTVCYGQKRMSQPAAASGASCQSVYNVRDFGAKGDGRSDDTKAIQSALDYAIDHGGGTVYFPNGRYRLATMQENYRVKAHLIVKPKKSPGKRDYVMIRLRGETCVVTPCSYANHTGEDRSEVWDNGTVLFSDVLGEPQTDPAATPACILAAGTGSNLYSLNQAVIRIEDLAFQAKACRVSTWLTRLPCTPITY